MGDRRLRHLDRADGAGACAPGALGAALARLGAGRDDRPRRGRRGSRPRARRDFASEEGERALKAGTASRRSTASALRRAELAAAGGLLAYLDATRRGAPLLLAAPRRRRGRAHGDGRGDARQPRDLPHGRAAASPAACSAAVDRCVTGAGAAPARRGSRRAADRPPAIEARLELVAMASRRFRCGASGARRAEGAARPRPRAGAAGRRARRPARPRPDPRRA